MQIVLPHEYLRDLVQGASAQKIIRLLEGAGHQTYFVGDAYAMICWGVRSKIRHRKLQRPETMMALAKEAGIQAVPTGIKHGTVTLIVDSKSYEITTFRRDLLTDGRHAKVVFSSDLKEDAQRRDFTMNALYATADGTILDPLSGWRTCAQAACALSMMRINGLKKIICVY